MFTFTMLVALLAADITLTTTTSPMSLEGCMAMQEVALKNASTAEFRKDARLIYTECKLVVEGRKA